MQKCMFSVKGLVAASAVAGVAFFVSGAALAVQTVTPSANVTGTPDLNATTVPVPSNGSYTFYGVYSDNQANSESGLGLKLKYDATKVNVVVSEEYTKCRIAPAQSQVNGSNSQWVMGWIDTSIRRTSGTPNGQVGWPDVADPASPDGCLAITPANTDTGAGSASAQKLFKAVVTWVGSPAVGATAAISLDAEGNFSYASASPGFTNKGFTVQAAAPNLCNLDVDGSGGTPTAGVDGLLIKRALNSFIPAANITIGVTFPVTATRAIGADIRTFVNGQGNVFDVDGNGASAPTAGVDGVLIQRALNTFITSAAVTTGVTTTATGAQVRTYLNTTCGTSLTP
ncbi:MAG: hypothetical protein EAZ21_13115 [Betaproteobacteria bacterium]|nr:MAG: hypothetical protein EAZ21_13115 [Betaproteobacteria bacterium]